MPEGLWSGRGAGQTASLATPLSACKSSKPQAVIVNAIVNDLLTIREYRFRQTSAKYEDKYKQLSVCTKYKPKVRMHKIRHILMQTCRNASLITSSFATKNLSTYKVEKKRTVLGKKLCTPRVLTRHSHYLLIIIMLSIKIIIVISIITESCYF